MIFLIYSASEFISTCICPFFVLTSVLESRVEGVLMIARTKLKLTLH